MITMTEDQYSDLIDDNCGMCINCHSECDCVEPDAREYYCPECKSNGVYGMEELLLMGKLKFREGE